MNSDDESETESDNDEIMDQDKCDILNEENENKVLDHAFDLHNEMQQYCIETGCNILDECRTTDLYDFLLSYCNIFVPEQDTEQNVHDDTQNDSDN